MTVLYPLTARSNLERLAAVYNLREQFRLEHNRQGEIARADWTSNRGKWKEYTKQYRRLIAPLGAEYVRLREAIRKANFSDAEWERTERTTSLLDSLFGNKAALKQQPTLASVSTLAELKGVDLSKLSGAVVDPYEDWTTYTETDPNSILTVAANQITFATLLRQSACTVYADKGVGHFGATFQHLIDTRVTAIANGNSVWCLIWELANVTNADAYSDPMISVAVVPNLGTNQWRVQIEVDDGAVDQSDLSGTINLNSIRYLTIDKNATDTDCHIYSDSARTTLVSTETVANGASSLRYMHNGVARGGSSTDSISGDIYNQDLQEAGVTGNPWYAYAQQ